MKLPRLCLLLLASLPAIPAFMQVSVAQESAGQVREPSGYRQDDYRAPTPATVDGRPGLSTQDAQALWKSGEATFIDVLKQAPKPDNLAPGTIWHDTPRSDIPGSLWLPDVGYGALAQPTETYFRAGLEKASKGDPSRKLVFYCLKDCWMSWNATKRARSLGYENAEWYAGGTDDWAAAGLPLEDRKPEPR